MTSDRFEPLPLTFIRQILIEGPLVVRSPEPDPYQVASGGMLTGETLRRAFDELWNGPARIAWPAPAGFGPMPEFRNVFPRTGAWRYLDWTVEAGGWRLVIAGGVMIGLVRVE